MEDTRYSGLAGKARRVRHLNRVTRMYAQQLIDEYLYPDSDTWRPERYIPIRSRNEFLPTVASISNEQNVPTQRQLELPLIAAGASAERSTGVKTAEEPLRNTVIRPPRTCFQPTLRRKQKQSPFTPGGFLFGCALGSAAAAVVLLAVQIAVK